MNTATAIKSPDTKPSDEKSEHQRQVEIERAESAKYLAANPGKALGSGAAISALQQVYFSNIPKQFEWGRSLTREAAFSLAVAAAQTGLNPLFNHIIMLGGTIYLTEKGAHHLANTHPQFDGYELTPIAKSEYETFGFKPDEVAWRCLVFRKDRSRPTPGYGRASAANTSLPVVKTHWLSEMSQKRAIQRAMIRAFNLPFIGADEPPEEGMINVSPVHDDATPGQTKEAGSSAGARSAQALLALKARRMPAQGAMTTTTTQADENYYGEMERDEATAPHDEAVEQQPPPVETVDVFEEIKGTADDDQMRQIAEGAGHLGISTTKLREMVVAVDPSGKLTHKSAKTVIAEMNTMDALASGKMSLL